MRVADIASGPGTTALLLAEEFHVRVVGLELGSPQAAKAALAARRRGLEDSVAFIVADGESVPLADGCMDAVICECAFCTFPDKQVGAAEMARLLRAGGRVAISDVVLDPGGLPPELQGAAGWVACLAGALPAAGYEAILAQAGLRVTLVEPHPEALVAMIDQIEARLIALGIVGLPPSLGLELEPGKVREVAGKARAAVAEGTAGYVVIVAEKIVAERRPGAPEPTGPRPGRGRALSPPGGL